jgi:hypothetical protein
MWCIFGLTCEVLVSEIRRRVLSSPRRVPVALLRLQRVQARSRPHSPGGYPRDPAAGGQAPGGHKAPRSGRRLNIFSMPSANIWRPSRMRFVGKAYARSKSRCSRAPNTRGGDHLEAVRVPEKASFRVMRQGTHIVMSNGQRMLTIPRHDPVDTITRGVSS